MNPKFASASNEVARRGSQSGLRRPSMRPLWSGRAPVRTRITAATDDTLGALAQRTGLDQSTLLCNLRALEAEGLVEIAIVASDLRRRTVASGEGYSHLTTAHALTKSLSVEPGFADSTRGRPNEAETLAGE